MGVSNGTACFENSIVSNYASCKHLGSAASAILQAFFLWQMQSHCFSGAFVCFDVCLVSGRTAVISCVDSERLRDMQVQIAGELDLGNNDEIPLLQFFKQGASVTEPLDHSTCAAEIVGCTIQVVLQEHPEWYVQKCFLRRTAELSWDVEEERRETLSLLPDGQFTYEMRRLAWEENAGRLAVKEDVLQGTGRWRCGLQAGVPRALPEEVLLLNGSASWLSSTRAGRPSSQRIRRALPKVALREYEISQLLHSEKAEDAGPFTGQPCHSGKTAPSLYLWHKQATSCPA